MEAARHRLVVSSKDDMGRLSVQALRSGCDGDPRRLRAAELAPVDAEEDALFRRARGNRAGRGGDGEPRHVARPHPSERGGAARADVDVTVPEGVVIVDGHHRAAAACARSATVLVVSGPA